MNDCHLSRLCLMRNLGDTSETCLMSHHPRRGMRRDKSLAAKQAGQKKLGNLYLEGTARA